MHKRIKDEYKGDWHNVVSPQTIKLILEKKYKSVVKHMRVDGDIRVRSYTGIKLKKVLEQNTSYSEPKHKSPSTHIAEIKNTRAEIREDILNPSFEIDWVSE